jgi:hypothetical protein
MYGQENMSLFFSLKRSRADSHTCGGLDINIYLGGYRGPASYISFRDFSLPVQQLVDEGLQGVDVHILDSFSTVDFARFADGLGLTSTTPMPVDLYALAKCFRELAQRNWLPEHFEPPSNSKLTQRARRVGTVHLRGSHFYNDSDDWGYHLFLHIWVPDNPIYANDTPVRVLYISVYKDSSYDPEDFVRDSVARYWLQEIEEFPYPVEVNTDGAVKKNVAATRQEANEEPVDEAARYLRQLELRQTQIDLLTEKLLELQKGETPSSSDDAEEQTSLSLAFWNATSLKPGMFGFSIDLKVLVSDTVKFLEQRDKLIELGLHKPSK